MADNIEVKTKAPKFAGIGVMPELTKINYFFLFFNAFLISLFMTIPAVIQPAFMNDIIGIDQSFAGSINSFLQNMGQVATLALVAIIGSVSDKIGRKILILFGFIVLAISLYFFKISDSIADFLNISPEFAARVCSYLSLMPGKIAEFESFAPGLLVSYFMRFIVGIGLILAYPQLITMVGDYTTDKDRGKGMAINGMAMGLASILAFIIFGSILHKSGVLAGFNTTIMIAVMGVFLTALFVKDRMPEKQKKKEGLKDIIPLVKESKALKAAYLCALITRADIVVLATFVVAWGVKAAPALGMESGAATMRATLPMIIMGIVSFLSFPLIGIMLDKKGRMPTILISMLFAGVGILFFAFVPNPFHPICYIGAIFAGIGISGSIAGSNTMAIDAAPVTLMGTIMGGLITMQPIGILFFLFFGGIIFDKISPEAAFALKGIANLVLFIWLYTVREGITQEIKLVFIMEWEEDAKKQIMKIPGVIRQDTIKTTESHAENEGIKKITHDFCMKLQRFEFETPSQNKEKKR